MFWKKMFGGKTSGRTKEARSEIIDSATMKVVILSDLGNIRTNNEDIGMFFRIADEQVQREKGYLLIVADGMGGHRAGEVASRLAAETISEEYFNQTGNGSIEKNLSRAFNAANKKIFSMASSNQQYRGMGTTCTSLVVKDQQIYFAHAGDSRAYILQNNLITRITEDHTYVQDLVNRGEITNEEAESHPKRNILTNAMGTKPELRVDTGKCSIAFEQNNRLLLCSDGLYDYIKDNELADILNSKPLHEAANFLIQEAKKRGGHDNITVILAEKIASDNDQPIKETKDFDLPSTKEFDLP
ncbi:MAG: Stp1/IreP family PP2C-type Ser/Thr phosphatase [Chitinophagaceae bacterium]